MATPDERRASARRIAHAQDVLRQPVGEFGEEGEVSVRDDEQVPRGDRAAVEERGHQVVGIHEAGRRSAGARPATISQKTHRSVGSYPLSDKAGWHQLSSHSALGSSEQSFHQARM